MRIAWDSQGDGAPVLLIHGLGYTREGWGPLRERLARRYRVISFDNRGIGESEIPPGPYTVEQLAGDAVQVLDEAGVERAHVLGASLGGFVAQVVASEQARPGRAARARVHLARRRRTRIPLPEQTLRLMAEAPSLAPEVALRRFVENARRAGRAGGAGRRDLRLPPGSTRPTRRAGRRRPVPERRGMPSDRLERIAAPTLVVTGTADHVVDPRNSDLLAERIPDARLEWIEGAGHMLFWEKTEEFAGLVERFLG